MLKFEIKSAAVVKREGTSAKGKAYAFNEQEAWLDLPSGERRKVKVTQDAKLPPYPIGVYELAAESFVVNQYGELSLGRLQLQPVKVAAARVA